MTPFTDDELRSYAAAMKPYSGLAAGVLRLLEEKAARDVVIAKAIQILGEEGYTATVAELEQMARDFPPVEVGGS